MATPALTKICKGIYSIEVYTGVSCLMPDDISVVEVYNGPTSQSVEMGDYFIFECPSGKYIDNLMGTIVYPGSGGPSGWRTLRIKIIDRGDILEKIQSIIKIINANKDAISAERELCQSKVDVYEHKIKLIEEHKLIEEQIETHVGNCPYKQCPCKR